MFSNFEDVRSRFPDRKGAYPSGWPKPTLAGLERLQSLFGCRFPPSFALFQIRHAAVTPIGDQAWDGFGWAASGLEPHVSLESILSDARNVGVPSHLVPFRREEGNYIASTAAGRMQMVSSL